MGIPLTRKVSQKSESINYFDEFISTEIQQLLYEKAKKIYQKNINKDDDPHSNFELGRINHYGFGNTKKDLYKALEYYEVAAKENHPAAQYLLCNIHTDEAIRSSKNINRKDLLKMQVDNYLKSASQSKNYCNAAEEFWKLYQTTRKWQERVQYVVHQSIDRVKKSSYSHADELGEFYNQLGYLTYVLGPVDHDLDAEQCFVMAGRLSNAAAFWNIANLIDDSNNNDARQNNNSHINNSTDNSTPHVRDYEFTYKAAVAGHHEAQFRLAIDNHYNEEVGKERECKKAYDYLLKSSKYSFSSTLYYLGLFHLCGMGNTPQNYTTAIEYFEQAVVSADYVGGIGCKSASICLGFMHEKGWGVEVNYTTASHYLATAAELQHDEACIRLAKLIEKDKIKSKEKKDAIPFYDMICQSTNLEASCYANYRLGKLYMNHYQHLQVDKDKHLEYLQNFLTIAEDQLQYKSPRVCYHLGIIHQHGYGNIEMDHVKASDFYQITISQAEKYYRYIPIYYSKKARKRLEKLKTVKPDCFDSSNKDIHVNIDD
ncbi:ERAD-associated E3 ubiquitin-protein ligase component HRD3A [Trichoplax sp. H2]|nr:ERAD-associated E3 ubiquitin-protein ligase component HRD3A [Trichoplax sp. H2]|eukprot:RDD39792.1 ERAD-associated E3 ubiquitin-protein ligase component HRD3A [Trichoplax sp. H2]